MSLRRIATLVLLFLLGLPSLYLYSKNSDLHVLLLSWVFIIYLWSLLKDSRYLVVLYVFILLVPLVLFYIHFYHSSIDEQILSIVIESNWQEALGFLGTNVYLYLIAFLIWCLGVSVLFWQNQRYPIRWTHRSRWWIIASVSIAASIGMVANQLVASHINDSFSDVSNNFLVEEKNSLLQDFKQTYPLGIMVSLYDLYQEQSKINKAFAKNQQFSFNATAISNTQDKQLVVLVIGETSRRANWQLNGYARNTNPLLSKQANVVNFTDMLGISNATRNSIPMMLTRKPAENVNNYDFAEKSIISAFKEAGFHTYWLSTQQKFGAFDTSTSVYAKEADEVMFLNKTNYNSQGDTDEVVLPVFEHILDNKDQKVFIVIHILGSHFNYAHRYPPAFDSFKPSLNDLQHYSLQDSKYKQQLINSYDNSTVYTDYVLNELIEQLKMKTDTESFLLYSSDHGEDLFDNDCNKSGHGNMTAYNFEIASFAWYSDHFARNNADKIYNLRAHTNQKVNQTSIFPSLIDAASINIPRYISKRSLLREVSAYPRLVMSDKDYDQIALQGSCREIK